MRTSITRTLCTYAVIAIAGGTAAAQDAAPTPNPYPRAIIARPLTYPMGILAVGFDLTTFTSSFFDPAIVRPLVGYGITDDLELNFAAYAFATDDAGTGSIDAGLGYKLLRGVAGGKLEVIARVQGGYGLAAEQANPIVVGVHAQYNLTPRLALITPGGQLSIAVAGDPKPISFHLPVSLAFQATPTLYLQLDTKLAQLELVDSANLFFGADTTPLFLGAYLNAIPPFDVFAGVGLDATPADPLAVDDTLFVTVGARYYLGRL